MKKRTRIILGILVFIGIVAFIGIPAAMRRIEANLEKLSVTPVPELDLSAVADGVYQGKFRTFPVAVEVQVTVQDRSIRGIDLVKHQNGQGTPAERITETVIAAQSLNVDDVSGATYSSRVILHAIGNALSTQKQAP